MKVFRYLVIVNLKPFDKKFEIINSFTHYWNAFKCARLLREKAIIIDIEKAMLMPMIWINGKTLPTESGEYWYVHKLQEEPFLCFFIRSDNHWQPLQLMDGKIVRELPKFWAKKNDLAAMSVFLKGD